MNSIEQQLISLLLDVGVSGNIALSKPPKPEMGDFAFACFGLAKEQGKTPNIVASELTNRIKSQELRIKVIEKVEAFGSYVNFFLNFKEVSQVILTDIAQQDFGTSTVGKGHRLMVEFAHPNTHKAFHIGHLRNIVTGESLVRILENVGYEVIRANYQGDVGMHIAKSLWGIEQLKDEYEQIKNKTLHERIAFLGRAYAHGGQSYEKNEVVQNEVKILNKKIYERDPEIQEVYQTTRAWSLKYFDHIYNRVGSHFNRFYFESEVYELGEKIVREFLGKGIFEESQGAIIFPGSKYRVHDRVFITSQGFPGYEAKEMGLGKLQFEEYHPEKILHVVGKEQTGYFQVVFKALEQTLPESTGKEKHMIYGWVHLKEGKMSSRTGNVVLGEWLLDEVKQEICETMQNSNLDNIEEIAEKVAIASVKYAFLKTGIDNDIAFDMKESVSTTGDSGPYLLYIVARISSILRKSGITVQIQEQANIPNEIDEAEKQLMLKLYEFSNITETAAMECDPSKVAHYLFDLAREFNHFYGVCPVLNAEESIRLFRLHLISLVKKVMQHGLYLLGVQTVEEM